MPQYLVTLAGGRDLVVIQATNEKQATDRAKGIGHILDFLPSLPLLVREIKDEEQPSGVPVFHEEYFEIMGFTK